MKHFLRIVSVLLSPTVALSLSAQQSDRSAFLNDRRIEAHVRAVLAGEHAIQASSIMSSVIDGVVLVSGSVRNEAEKALVKSELSRIEGVKAVSSNLIVGQGAGGENKGSPAASYSPPATASQRGDNSSQTTPPPQNSERTAHSPMPAQLVGEWKSSFDVIDLRADGSLTRSTSRSDLFAYCGPTMTVATVGFVILAGNQITLTPTDGSLITQNGCTGASTKAHYVNRADDFTFRLGQDERTLILTGPLGTKNSVTNEYHKTSQ